MSAREGSCIGTWKEGGKIQADFKKSAALPFHFRLEVELFFFLTSFKWVLGQMRRTMTWNSVHTY